MPIGQSVVPVSASNSTNAGVPESIKLGDAMQLAMINLGDGFYNLRGSLTVDNVSRLISELNGEVIPGTGMTVKVRDYIALVDGILLGGQNKDHLDPTKFDTVTVVVGTKYLVLTPKLIYDSDGASHKDHDKGLFSLQDAPPDVNTGKILVATLTIPDGTTQVDSSMINNSVKDYLKDMDSMTGGGANVHLSNLVDTDVSASLYPTSPYNVQVGGDQREWAAGWFRQVSNTNTLLISCEGNSGGITLKVNGHNYSLAGSGAVSLSSNIGGGCLLNGARKINMQNTEGHGNTNAPFNVTALGADPSDDFRDGDVWFTNVAGVVKCNIRIGGVTKSATFA